MIGLKKLLTKTRKKVSATLYTKNKVADLENILSLFPERLMKLISRTQKTM